MRTLYIGLLWGSRVWKLDTSLMRCWKLCQHNCYKRYQLPLTWFVISWRWWMVQLLSHVWLFATPWTVTCQAPLSMGFPRQEYWSGLPFPSPREEGIVPACVLSHFSRVRLFATPWTVAHQAPLSMGFSSKNTGVGCHACLQGIFPTQGLNSCLLHLLPPVLADGLFYHQRHLGKEPVFKNRSYKTGRNGCSG